jgi:putative redox protein
MGMDVISILRKKRQTVSGFEVRIQAERAPEHPRVYTHIRVLFLVTGQQVEKAALERAIELSYDKYCPIANLIKPVVQIETIYEISEG